MIKNHHFLLIRRLSCKKRKKKTMKSLCDRKFSEKSSEILEKGDSKKSNNMLDLNDNYRDLRT